MSVRRATRFLKKTALIAFLAVLAVAILAAIQQVFHPFTPWINQAKGWLAKTERLLGTASIVGISTGMIVLTIFACAVPMFMSRVNKTQYRTDIVRGVIASVVFFLTQTLYGAAERYGKLSLIFAMALAIAVTMVIIEFLSLLARNDEEISLRTDLLGAVASGLVSGIVIKLIEVMVIQNRISALLR